ncbi:MAG: ComEC/Rec2 family competence protein [Chthoniobacteraceae bacterium]
MPFLEMRPRQPFIGLAVAAVLAIIAADRWPVPLLPVAIVLGLGVLLLWWRPRTLGCWLFTFTAFFALHVLHFHEDPARKIAGQFGTSSQVVHATGIVWDEPTEPTFWARDLTCFFRLKLESIDLPGSPPADGVVMNVSWAGPIPRYGDRVTLTGSARNIAPTRNPGQFAFPQHLARQGIYSEIAVRYVEDGAIVSSGHGSRVQAFAFAAQQWIQKRLAFDLDGSPEITALISSMVLGMRGDTPDDARELFQRTGTMHLFAVSGLNVAMLAGILLALLKSLRASGATAVAITLPLLAFYALVTGLPASCVRATIMASLILLAPVFDRRAVAGNSICAAAVLILAWDTNQLFAPGFQFSFVLVLTIVFLARRIERRFAPLGFPDPFLPRVLWSRGQGLRAAAWQFTAATLGVTLAAWLGSLAFTAGYFHLFSPAAIVANLIAVPIAFLVLALGVATLLVVPWWKAGAAFLNNANWLAAKLLLIVIKAFALLPGGYLYVEVPRLTPVAACECTVLDLRDGAAIHLRSGGCDWLLDCGSNFDYGRTVLPFLRSRGVNRLDGLLLTHGDVHHLGGGLTALDDFRPRRIVDSPLRDRSSTRAELQGELASRRLGKAICVRGDFIRIAPQASLRVLFPPAGLKRSLADDKALVLQLDSAGTRVLFMSDSGFSTEQWLLENEPDLRSDIVVKGHHSKDLSGTLEFLARVEPQAVICSQLEPTHSVEALDEWERAATARGIAVFRQDRTGAVHVELRDRGEFEVRAFVGDQTLRSRAR